MNAPVRLSERREPSEPLGSRDTLIAAIIGGAQFISMLDATIIVNALPTMAGAFHQSPVTLNLAITAYLISAAIFLPVGTWIADRYGARGVFRAAIGTFAIASMFCGMAHSLWEMVAARMIQGAAGAMMLPVGRLILLKSVPRDRLMGALAVLSMPAMLGPVLGQPIGGFIVTYGSWRWIFFINLPIAALGIVLVSLFVPDVKEEEQPPLDWRGFALAGIALASVMFAFENVGRGALPSPVIAALFAIGGACGWALVRHTRRATAPIVDLALLEFPTFRAAVTGGLMTRFQIGATPFLLALLLQVGFGLSAFVAGLLTCAGAAGSLLMKTVAPPMLRRFGFRTVLLANTVLTSLMLFAYAAFGPHTPHLWIFSTVLLAGFFRSLQFTALNAMAYADVPHHRMSRASSLTAMFQQLSQGFGVGLAALLLHVSARIGGHERIALADISVTFVALGLISLTGLWFFLHLPADAGSEMSGHRRRPIEAGMEVEEEAA